MSCVRYSRLCRPGLWDVLTFLSIEIYSQVPLEIPDWVPVRVLSGLPRTFRVVPKSPGIVFSVINLLKGEPSAQSEALRAADHVFIKYIGVIFSFHSSIIPDQSFSPGCWQIWTHQHCLTVGMVVWVAGQRPKAPVLISPQQRIWWSENISLTLSLSWRSDWWSTAVMAIPFQCSGNVVFFFFRLPWISLWVLQAVLSKPGL